MGRGWGCREPLVLIEGAEGLEVLEAVSVAQSRSGRVLDHVVLRAR